MALTESCAIRLTTAKIASSNVSGLSLSRRFAEIVIDTELVKWLSKDGGRKCMICTGEAMSETVLGALAGMEETAFKPEHTVRLDNKYACFADFKLL